MRSRSVTSLVRSRCRENGCQPGGILMTGKASLHEPGVQEARSRTSRCSACATSQGKDLRTRGLAGIARRLRCGERGREGCPCRVRAPAGRPGGVASPGRHAAYLVPLSAAGCRGRRCSCLARVMSGSRGSSGSSCSISPRRRALAERCLVIRSCVIPHPPAAGWCKFLAVKGRAGAACCRHGQHPGRPLAGYHLQIPVSP